MLRQAIFVITMVALSDSSLAQSRSPFTGTRTFCGSDGSTAVISIGKDGLARVKTNMWTGWTKEGKPNLRRYVIFSGKFDTKGNLKRDHDMYLHVKSGSAIEMWGPQDSMEGKLCRQLNNGR